MPDGGCKCAWRLPAIVALAVAMSGCSTRIVPKPTVNPETSYKLITPPDAPHYTLRPGQSAKLPKPIIGYFAPPVYPAALVKLGMPLVVIKAQVVFGADGNAQHAYILSNSCTGTGSGMFADAVQAATAGWRFTPLVFEQYGKPTMATGALQTTTKPFSLWFEFDFRVVDGKSTVETVKR